MAIKFFYPPLVLKKMARVMDRANVEVPPKLDPRCKKIERDLARNERGQWVKGRYGLNEGYLRGCLAGDHLEPSGRVLKNMGFEVYIKDLETGEIEKIDYFGTCEVDHSDPANPKVVYVED